nr:PhzF family phenazine biosynthesis isomerase [Cupriavidus neocaledonicus]
MNKPQLHTMPARGRAALIDVFVRAPGGGNPVPLVADAQGMSEAEMQQVAARHGHESAFVLPPSAEGADLRLRFFVPRHEMEMCGHATVGALWALRQWGRWTTPAARVETLSGIVAARWDEAAQRVWISQPPVQASALDAARRRAVAAVLGLPGEGGGHAMTNACTSRVKTLVAMPDVAALAALRPDFARMAALCDAIGSTGLYPYADAATDDPPAPPATRAVHARQFPRASGYPEDAATGIAAAALWGHLAGYAGGSAPVLAVRQGETMGRPSEILVAPRVAADGTAQGCWLTGAVHWSQP